MMNSGRRNEVEDEVEEERGTFSRASAAELAQRRIVRARRPMRLVNSSNSSSSIQFPNFYFPPIASPIIASTNNNLTTSPSNNNDNNIITNNNSRAPEWETNSHSNNGVSSSSSSNNNSVTHTQNHYHERIQDFLGYQFNSMASQFVEQLHASTSQACFSIVEDLTERNRQLEAKVQQLEHQLLQATSAAGTVKANENINTCCVVCLDKSRNIVLLPCRHCCLCQGCFDRAILRRCPICKCHLTGNVVLLFP